MFPSRATTPLTIRAKALWKIQPRNRRDGKAKIEALLAELAARALPLPDADAPASMGCAGRPPARCPSAARDSRRSLELVTAFYHSSETHENVPFPLDPDHPRYKSWVPEGFR